MAEKFEHTGVIKRISSGIIYVQIVQESACAACHANGACSAADVADKEIEVTNTGLVDYKVGQKVALIGAYSFGLTAVMYAFLLPLLCMIITLFVSMNYVSELRSGLMTLGILLPYYTVLFLFRKKLKKRFSFGIKPIKED